GLEVAVGALDRAVLVRDAAIVAARHHAVMATQRVVAACEIGTSLGSEIAERRRETVAAMLLRRAAQRPERILQPFRERHIALAAEHDMGMLEARPGEAEVIKPMIEGNAGNGDAELRQLGEVRQ